MNARTAIISLTILFLLIIAAASNFNTFLHNFLYTALHPQESSRLLIGSATAFFTLLLVASFFALTRKLSHKVQAQKEWEQTFNTMTDLVSVHDKDFKVINANTALCEFLDKPLEEILGNLCYQLFHDNKEPFADCPHKKALKTGHAASEVINDPNLGVPLRITCSPFFNADGEFQGSVHIARIIDPADQVNNSGKKIIPVCASCKDIRKEDGEWIKIEHFFINKFGVQFTHSICRKCQEKLYPEYTGR